MGQAINRNESKLKQAFEQEELRQTRDKQLADEHIENINKANEFNSFQALGAGLNKGHELSIVHAATKAYVLHKLGNPTDEKLSPEQTQEEYKLTVDQDYNRRQIEFIIMTNKDSDERGDRAWRAFTDTGSLVNTSAAALGYLAGLLLTPENYLGGWAVKWLGAGAKGISNSVSAARATRAGKIFGKLNDSKVATISKNALTKADEAAHLTALGEKVAKVYKKYPGKVLTGQGVAHGVLNAAEIHAVQEFERKFNSDSGTNWATAAGFALPVAIGAAVKLLKAKKGANIPYKDEEPVTWSAPATKEVNANEIKETAGILKKGAVGSEAQDTDLATILAQGSNLQREVTNDELLGLIRIMNDVQTGPIELAVAKGLYTLRRVDLSLNGKLIHKLNEALSNFAKAGIKVSAGKMYEDLTKPDLVADVVSRVLGKEIPDNFNDIQKIQRAVKLLNDSDVDHAKVVDELMSVTQKKMDDALSQSGPRAPKATTSGTGAKQILQDDALDSAKNAAEIIASRATRTADELNEATEVLTVATTKVVKSDVSTEVREFAEDLALKEAAEESDIRTNIHNRSKAYDEQASANRSEAAAKQAKKERVAKEAEEAKVDDKTKKVDSSEEKALDDLTIEEKLALEKQYEERLSKSLDDFIKCLVA